jgi:Zn-finger nucleic acid-binding protein
MDMGLQCPHCFLDMKMSIQLNEEVNECPSCEGLWLDSVNLEKIFGFGKLNIRDFNNQFQNNIMENSSKAYGGYYYYKKQFQKNVNKDDIFEFE